MGSEDNGEMRLQQRGISIPISGSDFDPLLLMDHSLHFPAVLDNLVQFPSDLNLVDMLQKITAYESDFFPGITSSFGLSDYCPNYMPLCKLQNSQENCWNLEQVAMADSTPKSHSLSNAPKNVEDDLLKDASVDKSECSKKRKAEENNENYVHVRAKRGHATNSHSLAERVRRERISERMRFLQEIVPGCKKITGKAVMLDEIINYVQSLQQQVEFLSMKLAAVEPELQLDIEQAMSKEILSTQGSNAILLGFDPSTSSSMCFLGLGQ